MFATVTKGQLVFHGETREMDMGPVLLAVPARQTKETIAAVAALFRATGTMEINCSSSLDYPRDGEAHPRFNGHGLIDKAFTKAQGRP